MTVEVVVFVLLSLLFFRRGIMVDGAFGDNAYLKWHQSRQRDAHDAPVSQIKANTTVSSSSSSTPPLPSSPPLLSTTSSGPVVHRSWVHDSNINTLMSQLHQHPDQHRQNQKLCGSDGDGGTDDGCSGGRDTISIDLLSLDLDNNDFHIFRAMNTR